MGYRVGDQVNIRINVGNQVFREVSGRIGAIGGSGHRFAFQIHTDKAVYGKFVLTVPERDIIQPTEGQQWSKEDNAW